MVKNNHLTGGGKQLSQSKKRKHHQAEEHNAEGILGRYADNVNRGFKNLNNQERTGNISNETAEHMISEGMDPEKLNEIKMYFKLYKDEAKKIIRNSLMTNEVEKAGKSIKRIEKSTGKRKHVKGMRNFANTIKNQIKNGRREYKKNLRNILRNASERENNNNNNENSPPTEKTILVRSNEKGAFVEVSAENGKPVQKLTLEEFKANLNKKDKEKKKIEYVLVKENKQNVSKKTHRDLFRMKKDYSETLRESTYVFDEDGNPERFYNSKDSIKTIKKDYPFYYKNNETYTVLSILASINIPKNKAKSNEEYKETPIITYKKEFRKKLLKAIPELTKDEINNLADIDDNLDRDQAFRNEFPNTNLEFNIREWNREIIVLKLCFFFLDNTDKNKTNYEFKKEKVDIENIPKVVNDLYDDFKKVDLEKLINAVYDKDKDLYYDLFNFFSTQQDSFSKDDLKELTDFIAESEYIQNFFSYKLAVNYKLRQMGYTKANFEDSFHLIYEDNMTKEARDLIIKRLEMDYEKFKKYRERNKKNKEKNKNVPSYNVVKKQAEEHENKMKEIEERRKKQKQNEEKKRALERSKKIAELKKKAENEKNHLATLRGLDKKLLKDEIMKLPEELRVLTELHKKDRKGKITMAELSQILAGINNMNELRNFIRSKLTPDQQRKISSSFFKALKDEFKKEGTINKTFKRFNKLLTIEGKEQEQAVKFLEKIKNKKLSNSNKQHLNEIITNKGINENKFKTFQSTNAYYKLQNN